MISALLYLQGCSLRNRIISRVKRLKKPKYLVGLIVGGLYFYFFFFRPFSSRRGTSAALPGINLADYSLGLELIAAFVLCVVVVGGWILSHERAALVFTEAEMVFLFSAPVRRKTLLHFKLLKSQAGILVTTLLMAFLSTRFGARGNGWLHFAGWWVILSLLNLHFLGASFVRTRLLDSGLTNWRRRAVILALLAVLIGVVVFWARDSMRAPTEQELARMSFPVAARYVEEILGSGPAPYLLYPFRLVVRPYLARDAAGFLAAMWPALLLLAAHYVWVIRSNVAFEEASLALAQKRAQIMSAAKHGQIGLVKHKPRRGPFDLRPTGPPAVALLWKNLIATGSIFRTRLFVVMAIVLASVAFSVSLGERKNGLGVVVGMITLMALLWSIMLGPMILRHDFRSDLKCMDLLKQYPLAGWRVALGQLLAPALVLTGAQWLLLLVGVIAADVKELHFLQRLSIGAGALVLLPMLNLLSLVIPNGAVLLFPAWFQTGQDATQGIEATGQRLIFALGQFFVFLVALIPAGGAGALVFFIAQHWLHWTLALPLAALPAALVLGAEAAVGIGLLGKAYEKFDLSAEPQA